MAEKNKASKKATKKKKNVFSRIISYFRACIGECKRLVGQHGSTQQEISALFLS